MELIDTPFQDLYLIKTLKLADHRGLFAKTFHAPSFEEKGIFFTPREEFYSISHTNVLRGMHFQTPPHAHAKLVSCLQGRILDVVIDLRKSKGTYGQIYTVELNSNDRIALYIPPGFAHGFLTLDNHSMVNYTVSHEHAPDSDQGVHWQSIDFDWPCINPILSTRDSLFPAFESLSSPF